MENIKSDLLVYDAIPVVNNVTTNNELIEVEPLSSNEERLSICENLKSNVNNNTTVYQFSNINGLHIGPTVILKNIDNHSNKSSIRKKTRTIDMMMQSSEPLGKNMIETISTHLGKHYRSVIRSLGMSDGQIEQAIMDFYINGSKEVIYQLLLEWTRSNYDEATLGKITQILWKSNHKECVYKMKDTYKAGISQKT